MVNQMTVHVKRSRNYGKITMEYGLSADFEISDSFTPVHAAALLQERIDAMFSDYETNVLPKEQFVSAGQPQTPQVLIYTVKSVVKKMDGAKVTYAVKTREPKYAMHGAGIYEVLDNYPRLKALVDQRGEVPFQQEHKVHIDISNKHPRVIKIEGCD